MKGLFELLEIIGKIVLFGLAILLGMTLPIIILRELFGIPA